jgi:isopentenyl-diphosphate delta-isomerase type 1
VEWVSCAHDPSQHLPLPVLTLTEDKVVLLDDRGQPIGDHNRSDVHSDITPLHLAFSLYLFNDSEQVLFTRRSLGKATWPGVWTNSCCGHPRPGEPIEVALHRRLGEELGLAVSDLRCVLPDFSYRARDVSGIWENEICPVFVGRAVHPNEPLRPNSDEVMDWVWVRWLDVKSTIGGAPFAFSPWAVQQVSQLPAQP